MILNITKIPWANVQEAVPAFLTMVGGAPRLWEARGGCEEARGHGSHGAGQLHGPVAWPYVRRRRREWLLPAPGLC